MATRPGDLFLRLLVRVEKEFYEIQRYFIHRADSQPIFMETIGSTPLERSDKSESFMIVTSASDIGLVDIHDHRPWVLSNETAGGRICEDAAIKNGRGDCP